MQKVLYFQCFKQQYKWYNGQVMLQTKKNFWGKRPGFDVGDILHIGVNAAFVAVVYALVAYWSLPTLAIGLIFLGKWRTFAVQPRFWLPNIKANLVDFIVGISSVLLIHQSSYTWLGILWAVLYIGWLLFVKPRDSSLFVGLQAFWAQFIGLLVLFMIPTAVKTPLLTIVLIWLIAWSAARHFMAQFGPALKLPWTKLEAPELTEGLIDSVVDGTSVQLGKHSIAELERYRDDCLLAVQAAVKATKLKHGIALDE